MRLLLGSACLLGLSACATTSFAPPSVNLENEMAAVGSNASLGQRCMPNERLDANNRPIPIKANVDGARKLIDNFVYMYRCRAHSAANGRQAFDIPSFLALAGTSAASAFGAGPDVAIAGGVGNSLFTNGGKYYASQQKAEIYDHALDALLCIKSEAVGIDAFTLGAISAVERANGETAGALAAGAAGAPGADGGPEVTVTSTEQYYDLVTAALLSVERVAAQRLSAAGTPFDAAGVVAEIEALREKEEEATDAEAQSESDDAAAAVTAAPTAAGGGTVGLTGAQAATKLLAQQTAYQTINRVPASRVSETILELRSLQPKLQQCVVRAKV